MRKFRLGLVALFFFVSFSFAGNGDMGVGVEPLTDGTAEHPWLIEDLGDFDDFSSDPGYWGEGVHVLMMSDIDLSETIYATAVIAPNLSVSGGFFLDYKNGTKFNATFDGNGYIVSNLTIKAETLKNHLGLFGCIGKDGEVKNLGVEQADVRGIRGSRNIGRLCGRNEGNVINCYATGEITAEAASRSVGGLIGRNVGIVSNCFADGTMKIGDSVSGVGGLCGYNTKGIYIKRNMYDGVIINCYAIGEIISVIGASADESNNKSAGGLCGGNSNGLIINCYSSMTTITSGLIEGLCDYYHYSTISNCFWDMETLGATENIENDPRYFYLPGITTGQMQIQSTFADAGWDFVGETANGTSDVWQMPADGGYPVLSSFHGYAPVVLSGEGSEANPYLIGNAAELGAMYHYDTKACYKLASDIYLTDMKWSAAIIPVFGGSFDGDGYAIYDLKMEGGGFVGLFGSIVSGGSVTQLGIENVDIKSPDRSRVNRSIYIGALCARNDNGNISNCYATGAVSGGYRSSGRIGGMVGFNDGNIIDSHSDVATSNTCDGVGGLAGKNDGSITGSSSTGAVNGSKDVGGLVGWNDGSITSSFSTGAVNGKFRTGGLVGEDSGIISNSYSTGAVVGVSTTGGLVGGGSKTIRDSFSTGAVTGNSRVGGLVGNGNGDITGSFSTGAVTGKDRVGGLMGVGSANVTSSYSSGAVAGEYIVGGLVGWNLGNISNSYSNSSVVGNDKVGGLVGNNDRYIKTSKIVSSTSSITNSYSITGSIANSYSTGSVTGTVDAAGFCGVISFGNVSGCFWDVETSGMNWGYNIKDETAESIEEPVTVIEVVGKTTAEMLEPSPFIDVGWDFTNIWTFREYPFYPQLIWEP